MNKVGVMNVVESSIIMIGFCLLWGFGHHRLAGDSSATLCNASLALVRRLHSAGVENVSQASGIIAPFQSLTLHLNDSTPKCTFT